MSEYKCIRCFNTTHCSELEKGICPDCVSEILREWIDTENFVKRCKDSINRIETKIDEVDSKLETIGKLR